MAKKSESQRGIPENSPENEVPAEGSRDNSGGISNRPLSEEQERQDNLPPRGESKDGNHA
jgi:hypothetical protein